MPVPAFDVDVYGQTALPPNKQMPKWLLFIRAVLQGAKRSAAIFGWYMNNSVDTGYWDASITYSADDRVRVLSGVYQSLLNSNLNNAVSNTTYWVKVLDSFIGAAERVKYDGKYLTLTWALNRIFGTTFRQPPYPSPYGGSGTFSDIYIENDDPDYFSIVGFTDLHPENSSYSTPTIYYGFTDLILGSASFYQFTIFFPVAVYTALGADDAIRNSTIRAFVDPLVPTGLQYEIDTY